MVHRGGFCSAIRINNSNGNGNVEPGKVLVELEHNGEQMYVDDDDVEKANAKDFDLSEDLSHLKHLNEASVLHCIRQRYASNLIHTRAGPTLIVVNPMAPLSLYSEKVKLSTFFFLILRCLKSFISRSFRCLKDARQKICHHTSTH